MEMMFPKQYVRLSLFFFFLLFLSGRIGLLLHEFAGHALFWHLFNGKITEVSLFIFGGGRVHYGHTPATQGLTFFHLLAVHLSGIAVELGSGILLFLSARLLETGRFIRALCISASSVLIVHSLFYFTSSIYYGSGDGRLLFDALPEDLRRISLVLSFTLTVAGAFIVSYAFSPAITSWTAADSLKKRLPAVFLCALTAATLHGALTIGEQAVVKDRVYAEIKTPENVRLKRRKLAEFVEAYRAKHGKKPGPGSIEAVKHKLENKYRQFPIEIALGAAVLFAFIAGFFFSWQRNDDEPDPVSCKDIQRLCCLSAMPAALIIMLNRL